MATQNQIRNHEEIVDQLILRFTEFLEASTKTLENTVADRVLQASTPDQLLETRPLINRDFDTIFEQPLVEFMAEFDSLARDTIEWTPGSVTPEDSSVVSRLKQQSYARLSETVKSQRENIHSEIMMGALALVALPQIVTSVRHKISGLYITTSDTETTLLQNKLRRLRASETRNEKLITDTLDRLRKRFANVSVGGSLIAQTEREMHDLVMDFDGVFIRHRAARAGLTRYKYSGSLVRDSRSHCVSNVDRVFTEEEARQLWESSSWPGKRSGDPFVVRGGHRCRHFWVPVEE